MEIFKKIDKNKFLFSGLIFTFIILYGATAFVSWYHSISFFNIANEVWLSVLLSFVAEVGQASVLFSILLTKIKNKFLPWVIMIILTSLQVIGNVVSSYKFIVTSNTMDFTYFQNSILFWVETGSPEIFKVIIAWISGSLLPIISLSLTALVAQILKLRDEDNLPVEPDERKIVEELKLPNMDDVNKLEEFLKTYTPKAKSEILITEDIKKDDKEVYDPPMLEKDIPIDNNVVTLNDYKSMLGVEEKDLLSELDSKESDVVVKDIVSPTVVEKIESAVIEETLPLDPDIPVIEETHPLTPETTVIVETPQPIIEPIVEPQIIKKKSTNRPKK